MKLNPSFFRVPLRKSDSTIRKDSFTSKQPPMSGTDDEEPMVGMLVDLSRTTGGETRKISPSLTVTVMSNSMRENAKKQRQVRDEKSKLLLPSPSKLPARKPSLARELLRSSSKSLATSLQEEEEDEPEDNPEDRPNCASNAYTGLVHPSCGTAATATTGTLASWEADSDWSTLSDLTEARSLRRSAHVTPEKGWRDRVACALPACGAWDDDTLSAVGENSGLMSDESSSFADDTSAGCFILG